MPEELRRRLAASAAHLGRSLNVELVHRLERSLRASPLRAVARSMAEISRVINKRRGTMLRTRSRVVIGAVVMSVALLPALLLAVSGSSGGKRQGASAHFSKFAASDPDSRAETPGVGPNTFDAYEAAALAYPANVIPPAIAQRAADTFASIAALDRKNGDPKAKGHHWTLYGPKHDAMQPGVLAFSGATNSTASRVTALVVDPSCGVTHGCRVWAGVAGGGIWRTNNALAPNPEWTQMNPQGLDQNSVGTLILDPSDKKGDTLYLGTGEANRCSSGCEAGVGIYESTDAGEHWTKLDDACVSNATYTCVNTGKDAFLGRGITGIVIDPTDRNHLFVGSAQAVRGLSHVIGAGSTTRLEPGANEPGLYESADGGSTFTEVWDGAKPDTVAGAPGSFGINKVELDPLDPTTVYASAFDAGLWRRDHGAAATAFTQVFKPQFVPPQCTQPPPDAPPTGCALSGTDRTMFALTVKNNHTRIYLTEGTQPTVNNVVFPTDSNFWRTDTGDQSAATLLASQGACVSPDPTTHIFPATYTGWQCLTSQSTASPYFASDDFCTQQCWYDQDVYTPPGMPDTVYLLGSNLYGEQPCNTNGVGCGNGRSNGRELLYSDTAGDPNGSVTGAANMRTFTDLSYDAQDTPAPWCAFAPYFDNGCLRAPNGIHPDQHAIAINPSTPTQIFEGSDGGMIRTSGTFSNISSQCDDPLRPPPTVEDTSGNVVPNGSYTACKRLLSRVPTLLEHVDKKLSSTLQFINVAINPSNSREVMGGTQDNGTWSNVNHADRSTFLQVIYGDGGNAVYDGSQPTWRANEFTGGFGDSNFENGDPEEWVIATAPIVNSGEGPAFYRPQVGDPNPVSGTHPIYSGAKHVWRSLAFGAGTPHAVPQDTTPNVADYEAKCPEFVTRGDTDGCGDYQPLGGPYCDGLHPDPPAPDLYPDCVNQPGDLTGTAYGSDRSGGFVSWIARDSADHGTIWAATSAGRIFVTHDADASDPANVTWLRIDNSAAGASPTRFPSGITVDPRNANHAWISYSGYNAVTPSTPGHGFSVRNTGVAAGGVFTNLDVESGSSAYPTPNSDGDLPVSDIVRDDARHTLYASTDFGVLRGDNDGASWHVTAGMPRYEVMHLEIQPSSRVPTCTGGGPCKRVLYAATHSQGIWKMNLGGVGGVH
jgi:hypothetical protein